jgi:L-lactate dehydrogenase complex protein LldG
MNDREALFGRIKRAVARGDDATRRATVAERLGAPPVGVVPARGKGGADARVVGFTTLAEKAHATVVRLADASDVPAAVADFLRRHNLPQALRRGSDPRLAALPWDRQRQLTVTTGRSDGTDLVGLSHAEAGVAETGTLVLLSGEDNPTTLNFLPANHLVVVDAKTIVGSYEEASNASGNASGRSCR